MRSKFFRAEAENRRFDDGWFCYNLDMSDISEDFL